MRRFGLCAAAFALAAVPAAGLAVFPPSKTPTPAEAELELDVRPSVPSARASTRRSPAATPEPPKLRLPVGPVSDESQRPIETICDGHGTPLRSPGFTRGRKRSIENKEKDSS